MTLAEENARLLELLAESERRIDECDAHAEALDKKLASLAPHGTCGCSYDAPDDVCSHHSPALTAANEKIAKLRAALATCREAHARIVKKDVSRKYGFQIVFGPYAKISLKALAETANVENEGKKE